MDMSKCAAIVISGLVCTGTAAITVGAATSAGAEVKVGAPQAGYPESSQSRFRPDHDEYDDLNDDADKRDNDDGDDAGAPNSEVDERRKANAFRNRENFARPYLPQEARANWNTARDRFFGTLRDRYRQDSSFDLLERGLD